MTKLIFTFSIFIFLRFSANAQNPIVFADVPDMSIIRVGKSYYMSSTTMHMSPGLPIMKSTDLTNWKIINYAYDTLANVDALNLENNKNSYGSGSWASSLRYHHGLYYVTTFAQTTGKTYVFTTKNIEKGPWKMNSFKPMYHDHTIFFDDNGKTYMIYGAGKLKLVELTQDALGVKPGIPEQVIIENASAPAGINIGLQAEGSQLFKKDGNYYLFNIVWPKNGMRTVLVHRANKITGPWEGKIAFQDSGIAQGGIIDTPEGNWFAYLFRDYGSVGRIPYMIPVKWENGWPILGNNGTLPLQINLPKTKSLMPGIVASDEFNRKNKEPKLPLIWQWNHNPNNKLWSLTERKGFLRLKTGRIDTSFLLARNTLTQRTLGPTCFGNILLDISNMKEGDIAGLSLLQKNYGLIGVKIIDGIKTIVTEIASTKKTWEVPIQQNSIHFKVECNFENKIDVAKFYYSLDGNSWNQLGEELKMTYTLPHFMGYRFGIFNYSTKEVGGYVDVDFFRVK